MLEDFLNFVKDIGFNPSIKPNSRIRDDMMYLSYGDYTISIYNPEEHSEFEKRYSLELKKTDFTGKYIEGGSKNQINFALDDFEVLENEFKDVIRDNKLKKILRNV
jgi:hypothetical protein